MIDVYIILQEL